MERFTRANLMEFATIALVGIVHWRTTRECHSSRKLQQVAPIENTRLDDAGLFCDLRFFSKIWKSFRVGHVLFPVCPGQQKMPISIEFCCVGKFDAVCQSREHANQQFGQCVDGMSFCLFSWAWCTCICIRKNVIEQWREELPNDHQWEKKVKTVGSWLVGTSWLWDTEIEWTANEPCFSTHKDRECLNLGIFP